MMTVVLEHMPLDHKTMMHIHFIFNHLLEPIMESKEILNKNTIGTFQLDNTYLQKLILIWNKFLWGQELLEM